MKTIEKTDRKYALSNSYFTNKKHTYPDKLIEIVSYWKQHAELPFEYNGDNWVYDAMIERQKKHGVQNSQYLAPDSIASQIAGLCNSFTPEGLNVLDACCGTGQLTRYLIANGFTVSGFDSDNEMIEICRLLYPQSTFFQFEIDGKDNYENRESIKKKWELVVSNPPHERKTLIPFFSWLSSILSDNGKAILLLPTNYMSKDNPSTLANYMKRFNILHREEIQHSDEKKEV